MPIPISALPRKSDPSGRHNPTATMGPAINASKTEATHPKTPTMNMIVGYRGNNTVRMAPNGTNNKMNVVPRPLKKSILSLSTWISTSVIKVGVPLMDSISSHLQERSHQGRNGPLLARNIIPLRSACCNDLVNT